MSEAEKNQTEEVNTTQDEIKTTLEAGEITEEIIRMFSLFRTISILVAELVEKLASEYKDHRDPECVEAVEAFMRNNFAEMYKETNEKEKRLNEETLSSLKQQIFMLVGRAIKEKEEKENAATAARLQERDKINNNPKSREELETIYVKVWDTEQLKEEFIVQGFLAPYIEAERKSDKARVVLAFQHHPRYYFTTERKDEAQQTQERTTPPSV